MKKTAKKKKAVAPSSEKKTVKGEKKMKKHPKKSKNDHPFRKGSDTEKVHLLLSKQPHSLGWLEKKFDNAVNLLASLRKRGKETGAFKIVRQKDGKYSLSKAA